MRRSLVTIGALALGVCSALIGASCTAFSAADESPGDPKEAAAGQDARADGDAFTIDGAVEGGLPPGPPEPPTQGTNIKCGQGTCASGVEACCLDGKAHCIALGTPCAGPSIACDDRDDCPVQTGGPLPPVPIVCCLSITLGGSGCVRDDRCLQPGSEALCDPAKGLQQCQASGGGTCSVVASQSDYMRCQ